MTFWSAARRHIVSWSINSLNLFLFVITFGFLTVHEGHFYRYSKKWYNWNLYFSVKPKQFFQPTSEREISKIVESATRVRVVAGGHSFNPANLSPDTLINLDLFNNVIQFDKDVGIITVQAGIRLNDFSKIVEAAGYALPVMGTAHTQSIGGLVASDLHATGRESGYLSQQIESLKIINSKGIAEVFNDKSDVFKAALGGIGAMGVVVEVTIRLVKKFLVKRVTQYVDRAEAEEALERLLQRHQHVGFFYVGGLGAKKIRLTTYDEAHDYETRTRFFYLKNNLAQIFDMINGGFMIDFARFLPGFVQTGFFLWNSSFLGQPFIGHPGEVFTSSLFFRHDEMEYAMPIENFRKTITSIMSYLDKVQQTSLLEVRFCVQNAQSKALLGPGAGRESCFIEILPTLTNDTRRVFASTENFFAANGGRPHLGKYTTYQTPDMRKNFGNEAVERFLKARERQDPEQKFVNAFVHQVFLTEAQSNPTRPLY